MAEPATITIRTGSAADCDKVGALQVKAWLETYRGLIADSVLDTLSTVDQAATWRRILVREPPVKMMVAEDDGGRLVGFAGGGPRRGRLLPHSHEIYALYVLKAAQRRGLGRSLVGAVARQLREAGAESLCLWVLRDNAVARGFYEALGGILVGEKVESMGGRQLHEVAYGWVEVAALVARCDRRVA